MTFRIIKPVFSLIGGMLLCMFPIGAWAQITLWDTTLIEPLFQTGGGSVAFGTDLIFTGGNNNGGNSVEEFIVDINGQIKRRRIITDTSIVFPTEVGRMKKVLNEPYLYGAGVYFLNKFDTSGSIQWSTKYTYPFLQAPFRDFIQLKDKSVVAAGFRQFAGTGWDYFVTRIDSLGNTLWQIQYPHPNDQEALAITEMFDGSMIVGGNDGGKFRLLRIGLDGRQITGVTWPNSPNTTNIQGMAAALTPNKEYLVSTGSYVPSFTNNHQMLLFDKNLNVLLDTIDDWAGAEFIEMNEDSTYYLYAIDGFIENDHYWFTCDLPYDRTDSLLLSTGPNWKNVRSFARINDQSAFIVGVQDNPAPNDNDYWYGRLDGLKKPWIPDPCKLSPPEARFSFEYNYPVLSLYDSSFSGLKYHDTVYTWQWNTNIGTSGTNDSLLVFFDTAISKTLDVQLIISNWYECFDTVNVTLNFDPSGITSEKQLDVQVYPNPVKDQLRIDFEVVPTEETYFELFDVHGIRKMERSLISKSNVLRFSDTIIPPGIYLYQIVIGDHFLRGKLIIN